jgi:prepilin-type processing-associated H-X9-DG protein
MGIALHCYHDSNQCFPAGFTATNYDGGTSSAPGWGWAAYLLPFVEEQNVAGSIDYTKSMTAGQAAISAVIKTYICPSDIVPPQAFVLDGSSFSVGPSSYVGICGSTTSTTSTQAADQAAYAQDGVFYCNSNVTILQILDGTSNTVMVGERAFANVIGTWVGAVPGCHADVGAQSPYLQTNPASGKTGPGSGQGSGDLVLCHSGTNNALYATGGGRGLDDCNSKHPNGSNYLFADGSVHFLRSVTSSSDPGSAILNALGTIAGGEAVNGDGGLGN